MTRAQVEDFFVRYNAAFDALDGDAVADLWHTPSGIADEREGAARLTWWPDEAAMRANHVALCEVYRAAGYGHATHAVTHVEAMGPQHAFAHVHWRIHHREGHELQSFATGYHLMRDPASPAGARVLLCTAHQENLQEMKRHAAV